MPEESLATPASFPTQSTNTVLETLKSSLSGLTEVEATERLKQYGPNQLTQKEGISPWKIFFGQFNNTLTIILLIAAVLILFIYFFGEKDPSDLIEAGLIFGITLMIAVLGFIQEFKAEKAVASLKKLLAFNATVKRDGKPVTIPVANLVPGDIVMLEEGMKIPADMRLLEVFQLQVNEASLTGESLPVTKSTDPLQKAAQINDQVNMAFSGTAIASGRGIGVVTATGNKTEIGKIAQAVASAHEDATPLQKHLEDVGKKLGYLVLGISIFVFVFIMFFAHEYNALPLLQKVIHSFIASVALAVAAIPEGLPAVVTISLALGTQRLLKKKALVKKLTSVETLGSTDVICSDKTGTLTKGEMTVREIYFAGTTYTITGTGYGKEGGFQKENTTTDATILTSILTAATECTNAEVKEDGTIRGDPTEAALIVSALKAGITKKAARVFELPFSSERKRMSVVVKNDTGYVVYTKGAPEIVLSYCTKLTTPEEKPLDDTEKQQILETTHTMSTKALRTLGIATRHLTEEEFNEVKTKPELLEQNLTFLGIQGMMDPPRDEVKNLISACHTSGIRVIMITGDHVDTAKAVANEIGITGDAISGEELNGMQPDMLQERIKTTNIFARVNPSDKMAIVSGLKKHGHVVAMTGDGVNDAPALKSADIGIAMGITGTDVAKEASDVVLLEDTFATIVNAISEGRAIYQNIKKFVHYLLACNLAEVLTVLFAIILFRDLPLTATMLLWINVVTDGLPAIALGLDPAPKNVMQLKPQMFQGAILTRKLWFDMAIFAVLLAAAIIVVYYVNLPEGQAEARGAAFFAIVMFEIVKLFLIRQVYHTPFFTNKWLFLAIGSTLLLQAALLFFPTLSQLFSIAPIDLVDWLLIGGLSVVLWILFLITQRLLSLHHPHPNSTVVQSEKI